MRMPLLASVAFALLAVPAVSHAAASGPNPEIVSLGHDTYALTLWANTGFTLKTDKLKEDALQDAAAYCAKLHRELKLISADGKRPLIPLTGFASAKVVFRALEPNDPELNAPAAPIGTPQAAAIEAPAPKSPTDAFYSDLMKLDDLRKRGLLTDTEFETLKQRLLSKYQ